MRRASTLLLWVALLLPPSAPAQPPVPVAPTLSIAGPASVDVYHLAELSLGGARTTEVMWEVLYLPDVDFAVSVAPQDSRGPSLAFCGPPGAYRVSVYAVVDGKLATATKMVVIGPAGPTPGPTPGPAPTPPPAPAPTPPTPPANEPLTAVAVWNMSQLAALPASQRELRTDGNMVRALQSMNIRWRSYDESASILDAPSWRAALDETGIPALVVVNAAGRVYLKRSMPQTADGVVDACRSLRPAPAATAKKGAPL